MFFYYRFQMPLYFCISINFYDKGLILWLERYLIVPLAGVAQWIERWPESQRVLFDSQSGHMPGLQASTPVGGVGEATTH